MRRARSLKEKVVQERERGDYERGCYEREASTIKKFTSFERGRERVCV